MQSELKLPKLKMWQVLMIQIIEQEVWEALVQKYSFCLPTNGATVQIANVKSSKMVLALGLPAGSDICVHRDAAACTPFSVLSWALCVF